MVVAVVAVVVAAASTGSSLGAQNIIKETDGFKKN